jgi:imidazolonepropionase-like amidohydrolase
MQRRQVVIPILRRAFLIVALTGADIVTGQAEVDRARTIATIRCGSVIDGISEQALGAQTLAIKSGRIVSMTETSPETIVDLDLSDYTCLPGLINTHVHLDANPEDAADYGIYARRTQADNLALILENAETTLRTGFTTVRHAGA